MLSQDKNFIISCPDEMCNEDISGDEGVSSEMVEGPAEFTSNEQTLKGISNLLMKIRSINVFM